MMTLGDSPISQLTRFSCSICKYYTNKKCNYDTHLLSNRHQNLKNTELNVPLAEPQVSHHLTLSEPQTDTTFVCNCGKHYKHRQGLWKHKKKCTLSNKNNIIDEKYINALIKQNEELLKQNSQLLELLANKG
jgi:hypothetical protein